MGGGRKTKTYTVPEKSTQSWSVNSSASARNLGKAKLAGVVFGCKHNTIKECIRKLLFGLPSSHMSYVKHIRPGLPLFLFNYSDRRLHGIFEAASEGRMNIDSHGWTENGLDCTPFPAQVRVRILMKCQPLLEDQFGPVIAENYYQAGYFWFELEQRQTRKLISMFSSSPISASNALLCAERATLDVNFTNSNGSELGRSSSGDDIGLSSSKHEVDDVTKQEHKSIHVAMNTKEQSSSIPQQSYGSVSKDQSSSLPQQKWSDLFTRSITTEKIEAKENLEVHLPTLGQFYSTWGPSCSSPDLDEKSNSLQDFVSESGQFDEQFDYLKQQIDFHVATDNDPYLPQTASMEAETKALEGDISLLDGSVIGNCSLPVSEEEFHSDVSSPALQVTLDKILLDEIYQLKLNQVKQDQKISSLAEELIASRREIKNLKQQLKISEYGSRQEANLVMESELSIEQSILIIGGFDGSSHMSCLDSYCPSRDSLESLCPMSSMRSYTSAIQLNGEIYVIGGGCYNLFYDTVESYNLENNQWVTRPSMNHKKGSLAGIYLNEKIFAIGGSDGVQCFSEVEVFDMDVGRWIPLQSMRYKRFGLAAAEINGAIYAVGGYDGKDHLKAVERYDPREHSWKRLGNMSSKRSFHSLAVLNEKLYAIGGYNGEQTLSTVEVFDTRVGRWTMGESMNHSRGYSAAVVIGNSILAIGGLVENNVSDKVECYTEAQGWRLTDHKAVGKRCCFSAVVL